MLGPLTNLGMALVKEPGIVPKIREIVLMGGGWAEGGNITPAAEFNIYVDPHAAHNVFSSGAPITMMPLDVTHKAMSTRARVERFRALGSPVGLAVAAMLDFSERFDEAKYGTDGGPLHDPCVIAWLLRPDLFKGKRVAVEIETASERTLGMTMVDWWGVTRKSAECPGDQPDRLGRILRVADGTAGAPLTARQLPLIRAGQRHVGLNSAAFHRFLAG